MSAPMQGIDRIAPSEGGMRTLAVVALKGGTGKTTVAVNLASRAHAAGLKVVLADMDPQGSSSDWSKSRGGAAPMTLPLKFGSLFPAQNTADNAGVDLMILDTRASSQMDTVAAVKAADLSLIVVRPTVIDLRAIAATVDLLRPLRRQAAFVINQAPCQRTGRDPVMVLEAIELLLRYGLAIAPVGLRGRQIYQTTFSRGTTPAEEDPASAAGAETQRLWDFAAEKLWPAGVRPRPAGRLPHPSFDPRGLAMAGVLSAVVPHGAQAHP
ncbi:MAG: AAA family ATPase [Caulobacteraceae bacterium]|nr:AAA family ATPase [Caulobacteraceae bacterium]